MRNFDSAAHLQRAMYWGDGDLPRLRRLDGLLTVVSHARAAMRLRPLRGRGFEKTRATDGAVA